MTIIPSFNGTKIDFITEKKVQSLLTNALDFYLF